MPDAKRLAAYYSRAYWESHTDIENERPIFVRQESQTQSIVASIQNLKAQAPRSILDIGAGHGQLLRLLSARFPLAALHATEMDERCLRRLIERGVVAQKVLFEEAPKEVFERRFDLITSSHVLEHSRDPLLMLRLLAELLMPDGLAMIEVPNCGIPYFWGYDLPHLIFFTKETMAFALSKAGLEVVDIMIGGVSAWEYVPRPTPKRLLFLTAISWYADSSLPDSWLRMARHLFRRSKKRARRALEQFEADEARLDAQYHDAFFNGSKDGTFIRAIVRKVA